jgi:hypothetical protein
MTLTNADLAAIRERAEAASPGPWDFSTHWVWRTELDGRRARSFAIVHDNPDDARFIAHSRTDIPALLDIIEEMREVLAWYADWEHYKLIHDVRRGDPEFDREILADTGDRARVVLARMEGTP